MAQFNQNRFGAGDWAVDRIRVYTSRSESINDILTPGYWNVPGWLNAGDILIVLAEDACAMVHVRTLTPDQQPIFEYFRSTPPPSAAVRKAA